MHVLGLLLLKCIESQSLESQRGLKNSDSFALAKLAPIACEAQRVNEKSVWQLTQPWIEERLGNLRC